jgi:endonuclease-3 related protein
MDLQALNIAHPDERQRRRMRSGIIHFMGRLLVKVAGTGIVRFSHSTIRRGKNNPDGIGLFLLRQAGSRSITGVHHTPASVGSSMKETLLRIFDLLLQRYGPLRWWPAETPLEVCAGAILTQNTSWGNVEKAIANLKGEGLLTLPALRDVPADRLGTVIRPAGFFNVKSLRLKEFIGWLYDRHGGDLDLMFSGDWQELRGELLEVKGIGRETADSILLYAGRKPTFVVDAYTKRLFSRLGLLPENAGYEEVRSLFMENLPADEALFNEYHALIVQHGKEHCRKRPRCTGCDLHILCGQAVE